MSVPEVEIVLAIGSDNVEIKQQCLDVRIKVFIDEQGFSMDDEIDAYDSKPDTAHILLRLVDNKAPIGTIRCARIGETEFKLSRLAVLDEYRKFKFGQKLVLALADYTKAKTKAEN
ncbi:acyl-CoA N-acyltransferase [Flagelloscypha sp. PMI_526]|nr:acyl-CoA N-acyltransferase [Flagelloscypha sp. PMI_526]